MDKYYIKQTILIINLIILLIILFILITKNPIYEQITPLIGGILGFNIGYSLRELVE